LEGKNVTTEHFSYVDLNRKMLRAWIFAVVAALIFSIIADVFF